MAAPKVAVGPKSDKIWRDAVMRAVRRAATGEDVQALEKLADKLVETGLGGDVSALKEIGDRIDGKPTQMIVGDESNPLHVVTRIERVIVDAGKPE